MKPLFGRSVSVRRQHHFAPLVLTLEDRKLLTVAPAPNLSAATIAELGQQLANFVQKFDAANGVQDLTHTENSLNSQITQLESHAHLNGFEQFALQFDVDALAVVQAAINDLSPPATSTGSTGNGGNSNDGSQVLA